MALTDETTELPEMSEMPAPDFVRVVTSGENLVAVLSDDKLGEIGEQVHSDYLADKESMSEWFDRMKEGLDLARLVKPEKKAYPFENAANIRYPLVTSAALQYNARAYPAIVAADRVVKCKTFGDDPQGQKAAQADRVAEYESWQLSSQVPEWERETDKLLLQLPIVGTMVRKWWYDPVEGRPRCRLIEPGKFIVNNKVQDLKLAPRCSEELTFYPYELRERIKAGWFADFEWHDTGDASEDPQEFVEQHTRLDLDDDGYPEPYIVTLHCDTRKVVRLVADFDVEDVDFETEQRQRSVVTPVPVQDQFGNMALQPTEQVMTEEVPTDINSIRRGSYFVAYEFIPSMDGGFHGTGFGALLGDISEAINTIINMLLDAGHYSSLGGGFIGAGLKLRGGSASFRPGEYKNVTAQGMAIRENIVDRTFPGPDPTLFQLLGMLIEAGREIASVKDVMTGDSGGRQQTATTTLALIEQGMMVFTASYKRVFRGLKEEYRLLTRINAQTVTPEDYSAFHDMRDEQGQSAMLDPKQDFALQGMDIEPVADPRTVTKMQMAGEAQFLMELAQGGLVDIGPAVQRMLEALDIGDTEELAPKPDPMAPIMQEMQMEAAHTDLVLKKVEVEKVLAEIEAERAKAMKDTADAEATARGQRLETVEMMLRDERERLEIAIGARSQRLANAPRNGTANQADRRGTGGQGGADALALLERAAAPGISAGRPAAGSGRI